ncbi:zinc finger BED domain-containing protein RICESLEEPER 2-like [Camellia sinensis]|uniref:zinc finger BED domain-containing protein RICESLEEPER 2-like n=1 Tax=Camellia sinensis TaxID=4442 RepID=UPI001036A97B|nr:zinc finger BED domain-containing protein RICESLEEPER 2-like [Camellia sinensis]
MRCCAHILNLVVSDGLKEMDDSIINIRLAVRYVRSTPHRHDVFKKCAATLKLDSKALICLDVPTRWNSIYLMLEAAEKYEKAFNRLKFMDSNFEAYFKDVDGGISRSPKEFDWKKCRIFLRFLKLFYIATKKFSGSLFVTSNGFYKEIFVIESKIHQLILEEDDTLSTMTKTMKQKFSKYWGDGNNKKVEDMVDKVKSCLSHLYSHYVTLYPLNEKLSSVSEVVNMVEDDDDDNNDNDPYSLVDFQFNSYLEGQCTSESKSELEQYLSRVEHFAKNQTFEILDYWKYRRHILDPLHSSLSPSMVEALICTQNWLRSNLPISLRKTMDDVKEFEQNDIGTLESNLSSSSTYNVDAIIEL